MSLQGLSPLDFALQPNQVGGPTGSMLGAIQAGMKMYPQMLENKFMQPLLQQELSQQMAKSQTMGSEAQNAPQYYQGRANIESGIGQQELGAAPYSGPQAAANVGQTQAMIKNIMQQAALNQAQSKNIQQGTILMPSEFGLDLYSKMLQHPKSLLSIASGAAPYGQAFSNLATRLQSVPGLTAEDRANFISSTLGGQSGSSASSQNNQPTDSVIQSWPVGYTKNGVMYHYNPANPKEKYRMK